MRGILHDLMGIVHWALRDVHLSRAHMRGVAWLPCCVAFITERNRAARGMLTEGTPMSWDAPARSSGLFYIWAFR